MLAPLYVLLVALLLAPVTVEARAEITIEGGYADIFIRLLFLRVRLPFRACLFSEPGFTVWRIGKNGKADRIFPASKKKSKLPKSVKAFLRADARLDAEACFAVGTGDAARTALLCGALKRATESAAKALLPHSSARVYALPIYDFPCFRIFLTGITRFRIADVIRKSLEERGFMSHGASTRNHYAIHRRGAA